MNPAKSTMKPTPFSLEKRGAQYVLHYDHEYTFACDGEEYPSRSGLAVRCQEGPGRMVLNFSYPSHRVLRATFRLGHELNTMTATLSHTRVGKGASLEKDFYARADKGASLLGTWQPIRTHLVTPDRAILRVHDGYLYYMDTLDGNVADAKLDGTPAPWIDPSPKNSQWSNTLVNPRKIVGHALVDGKPVNTEMLELSPDGRSIKVWLGADESGGYAIFEKHR